MTVTPAAQRRILASGSAAIVLLAASVFTLDSRLLVWNATASVPRGLYARTPGAPSKGDLALTWLPAAVRGLAAERRYLPYRVPALKPVAAIAGDTVCASADSISINGTPVATRNTADHLGRELPSWHGCQTLTTAQLFLLSTYAPDSFDGRYFGPTDTADVIEKVAPLWTLR
jgi:conjugative transfer signal peptidase TraF